MSNRTLKQPTLPRIQEFYKGKSVFITGASGFLGVVILETLLRVCTGIERIYILVRPKKGVKPEDRKESIFNKSLFDQLKKDQPDVFKKVYVIPGDISLPDLGMDEIGLLKVIQNVNVVFHCAASISFLKPLRYILMHNAGATQNVVKVCRKLRNLDALVYTSTAFSNCNRKIVMEEEICRLPFRANKFLNELNNGKDDSLQQLVNQCQPPWPNHYTFSKCLAENILQDNAAELPIAIIRPSLIASMWKTPMPGYVEDGSGVTALSVGVGKGFIKVLHGDPEVRFDFIPVDVAAHVHILAAMRASTKRSSAPFVVNCTSFAVPTLKEYTDVMLDLVERNPLPNTFRTPTDLKIIRNDFSYWLTSLFEHHLPAFVFDVILKLSGSKVRLGIKYKFVEAAVAATNFFMTNSWIYRTENFQRLVTDLHPEDKQILETSCKGTGMSDLVQPIGVSAPMFQWVNDRKPLADRMRVAKQRHWLTLFIQASFVISVCCLTYMSLSRVFQL